MRPTEYIAGDRRGRAAHDLELAAMRDPLLTEALEGFETVPGNHADAVARLQKRLAARTARSRLWPRMAIAAALLAAVATTALLTLHQPDVPADYPAVAVATPPVAKPAETVPNTPAQEHPREGQGPVTKHTDKSLQLEEARIAGVPPTGKDQLAESIKQPASVPQTAASPTSGTLEPDRPECWEETETAGPQPGDINDVVVIAYGTRGKNTITGAVGRQPGAENQKSEKALTGVPPAGVNGIGSMMTEEDLFIPDGPVLVDEVISADLPFAAAETMPSFQGGDLHAFRRWVHERIRYQKFALANGAPGSRAVVSFVIDTTGQLGDIRILQSPDRSLSDEIIRVLKSSPRWEPGMQWFSNGRKKNVPIKYTMPVDMRKQK